MTCFNASFYAYCSTHFEINGGLVRLLKQRKVVFAGGRTNAITNGFSGCRDPRHGLPCVSLFVTNCRYKVNAELFETRTLVAAASNPAVLVFKQCSPHSLMNYGAKVIDTDAVALCARSLLLLSQEIHRPPFISFAFQLLFVRGTELCSFKLHFYPSPRLSFYVITKIVCTAAGINLTECHEKEERMNFHISRFSNRTGNVTVYFIANLRVVFFFLHGFLATVLLRTCSPARLRPRVPRMKFSPD